MGDFLLIYRTLSYSLFVFVCHKIFWWGSFATPRLLCSWATASLSLSLSLCPPLVTHCVVGDSSDRSDVSIWTVVGRESSISRHYPATLSFSFALLYSGVTHSLLTRVHQWRTGIRIPKTVAIFNNKCFQNVSQLVFVWNFTAIQSSTTYFMFTFERPVYSRWYVGMHERRHIRAWYV